MAAGIAFAIPVRVDIPVGAAFAVREHAMPHPRMPIALLLLALAAACAPRSRPVTLDATARDREALLGSWRGSYSIDFQRGGSISFVLRAGDTDAHGDVLMVPKGAQRPYGLPPGTGGPRPQGGPVIDAELLTIRFVQASGGHVTGTLVPYWDPDRACVASATFDGRLDGGRMSGTFLSTCERGVPTWTGRWSMRRVR